MKQVYNPNDEVMRFGLDGADYALLPNSVTELADSVADKAVASCGTWGVCVLGADPKQDKEKAEAIYLAKNREWCLAKADDLAKRTAKFAALSLKPTPTDDERYAVEWLKQHGF